MARPSADRVAGDYDVCRELIRQGSKTFFAASLLLPEDVRRSAYALYAFCRLSDDAVDGPDARKDAVERLRERLDRLYDGRPGNNAPDRAFADLIARVSLPAPCRTRCWKGSPGTPRAGPTARWRSCAPTPRASRRRLGP